MLKEITFKDEKYVSIYEMLWRVLVKVGRKNSQELIQFNSHFPHRHHAENRQHNMLHHQQIISGSQVNKYFLCKWSTG